MLSFPSALPPFILCDF